MTCAMGIMRTPLVGSSGPDRNVTSYRIPAYASIIYVGLVSVGCRLNL
jgi:hypothetical protein